MVIIKNKKLKLKRMTVVGIIIFAIKTLNQDQVKNISIKDSPQMNS